MTFRDIYRQQVTLLIRTLPFVADEKCFALKGGTAINLFIREMPRLSVDIDLTFIPILGWPESLDAIEAALKRIAQNIRTSMKDARVHEGHMQPQNKTTKLTVRAGEIQILIEVTPVSRGCIHDPETMTVSRPVEDNFGFAETPVVSFSDLYGGKLVAGLDRQHPRDFFDIRDLLCTEGINDPLRRAFIVYLLGHARPMHEILTVRRKDIAQLYERDFVGMTDKPVALNDLITAREDLIAEIVEKMPGDQRQFLIGFEQGNPDWKLLGLPAAMKLPAVKWRQVNLAKLDAEQRTVLVDQLKAVLKA